MTDSDCPNCGGTGWLTAPEGGGVVRCDCFVSARAGRRLDHARIPDRYRHCSLENFEPITPALDGARKKCESYVGQFDQTDHGLLIEGPVGVGKTHLAVGVLKELMAREGVSGLFVDYRDLLRDIQDSYSTESGSSELQVVRPLLEVDLLLLDELGARRPSAWVFDTVSHVLNDRYNARRPTIITTNYGDQESRPEGPPDARGKADAANLEERIGERLRSRLYEMCIAVPVRGTDFRREMRRAGYR